jgi:hypothetical protein
VDVSWRDRRDHEYGNYDRWVRAGIRVGHFPITSEKRKSLDQRFGRNVSSTDYILGSGPNGPDAPRP